MDTGQDEHVGKGQEPTGEVAETTPQSIKNECVSKSSKVKYFFQGFGLFVAALVFLATAYSSRQAARSAESAAESVKIMNATAYQAARSADSAAESVSITRNMFEAENRPYLYVKCAVPPGEERECNGVGGFFIKLNPKGCISLMSWAYYNFGKSAAEIKKATLTGTLFDKEVDLMSGRVDVFPTKELLQSHRKEYCSTSSVPSKLDFNVDVTYVASGDGKEDMDAGEIYRYKLWFKTEFLHYKDKTRVVNSIIEEY